MAISAPTLRRWLGPLPKRREAHAMAWLALAIGVALCGVSVLLGFQGRSFLGRPLGGDFVEFYTVGKILNQYPPARIYDLRLATDLQHAALPSMSETQMLVFGQAPFIASLFRPFALLPYEWAYVAWLGFSAGLYLASLALLFRTVRLNARDRKTGFLLALSVTPFLFETWIGGQMSVVVFFIWVLFFWCLENDRGVIAGFGAGFVLALCLFKPTLVWLPALMLVVGRRWRVVGGLAAGGVAMALLSLATVGVDGCRGWVAALAMNGSTVAKAGEAWHLAKYVDILAFSHLLFANWPAVAEIAAIVVAVIALVWLGREWWRSDSASSDSASRDRRLWAATLCFTLVVNPYVPIYDSILVVCAVALVASLGQAPAGWLLALYLIPWVTQSFAEFLHLQLMTVALVAFGTWALEKAGKPRLSHSRLWEEESTMTRPVGPRATGRFQVRSRGLP
ncbi:MAG: glycosyltransferase family 87 protein [Bryobacteraceae bacterium]